MRKVVILAVFVLVLFVLGIYWFSKPSVPVDRFRSCMSEVQVFVPFVNALEKPNADDCAKLTDEVFNSFCLAHFGVDVCNGTDDESGCYAILQNNLAGCGDDWTCRAVLGDESICTHDICRGLARRDLSLITSSEFCEQSVEEQSKIEECRRKAASIEEADTCPKLS